MKEEFLKELKELLKKYNVEIIVAVGEDSDLYGIYEESLNIQHKGENWFNINGWSLDSEDIKI